MYFCIASLSIQRTGFLQLSHLRSTRGGDITQAYADIIIYCLLAGNTLETPPCSPWCMFKLGLRHLATPHMQKSTRGSNDSCKGVTLQ